MTTIELSEYVIDAIADAVVKKMQEPKTGHWIMSEDGLYRPICDKCGAHPWKGYIPTVEEATEVFKYCPNCGARMKKVRVRNESRRNVLQGHARISAFQCTKKVVDARAR